jgi:small ligand-binding sensory domain FIST
VTEGGVSGVLLSENVAVATALSQSCSLIGSMHRVTRAEANVIIELDDRPALDVFKEDIGELLARDLRRIEGFIFVALPVRSVDTGDYLVRHIVGVDQARGLVAISEIAEIGQAIQFCRRDVDAAEEDLVRMTDSLKRRSNGAPRGAVYYSCVARGPNMFGAESNELRLIQRELGDVPLVGFFCYGEISHRRLYGYTGVLTLFL